MTDFYVADIWQIFTKSEIDDRKDKSTCWKLWIVDVHTAARCVTQNLLSVTMKYWTSWYEANIVFTSLYLLWIDVYLQL